jgi:hypothetical protein
MAASLSLAAFCSPKGNVSNTLSDADYYKQRFRILIQIILRVLEMERIMARKKTIKRKHQAWNKGLKVGKRSPFSPSDVGRIRK